MSFMSIALFMIPVLVLGAALVFGLPWWLAMRAIRKREEREAEETQETADAPPSETRQYRK